MANAYQLATNGYGNTVVGSLDLVFRHFASSLAGSSDVGSVGRADDYPALDDKGFAGSYAQRLRWIAEGRFDTAEILVHDLATPAGRQTVTFTLDLVSGFDPDYELQSALYKAESSDESLMSFGEGLQIAVYDGVQNGRRFGEDDEKFLARLRMTAEIMGCDSFIPDEGSAADILADLPKLARERFEEMADKAWPEESMAPQA